MKISVRSGDQTTTKDLVPGSRLWPPRSWDAGSLIADSHIIYLPELQGSSKDWDIEVALYRLQPIAAAGLTAAP